MVAAAVRYLDIGRRQLPIDLMGNTTAILGIRGTGKTTTACRIVEELLMFLQQVIIIDSLDVWWGLRQDFPIPIFGGDHGDAQLTLENAYEVATWLIDSRSSAILCLSHLTVEDQRKVVAVMAQAVYDLKATARNRTPVLMVIDEASMYVPQGAATGVKECREAIIHLVRRARSRGVGVMLIDQRAASISKEVLTQAETLLIHKQTSPQDRRAILSWVEGWGDAAGVEQLRRTLATLVRGEVWIWSPALGIFDLTDIANRRSFDSSSTPKHGTPAQVPWRWIPVAVPEFLCAQPQPVVTPADRLLQAAPWLLTNKPKPQWLKALEIGLLVLCVIVVIVIVALIARRSG
jgi:uncharacterized protein